MTADGARCSPSRRPSGSTACLCETLRARDRAGGARGRALARPGRPGGGRARLPPAMRVGARPAADRRPHRHRRREDTDELARRDHVGAGGEASIWRSTRSRAAASSRGAATARCRCSPSRRAARCRRCRTCTCARWPSGRGRAAGSTSRARRATIEAIADAFGRSVNDVTTIILDRPRHHDLIEEIRAAGARIKLIQDGDVTASISAAIRGTNDHLAIGIGGTRQAVMSAAALRCLGGELQAQLWPMSRGEIEQAREYGIDDIEHLHDRRPRAGRGDLRRDGRLERRPAARGALPGRLARTHSLVMCTRCNWVRFVDGIHFFARERREEVRFLG